jgi:hypothetical protein
MQFIEDSLDSGKELVIGERLSQIVFGSCLHRLDRTLDGRITCDHHHLGLFKIFSHMPDEIEATGARHLEVRDHQIYGSGIEDFDRFRHTGGSKDLVVLRGQIPLQNF